MAWPIKKAFKYSSIKSEASYNDRNILVKLSFDFFSIFVSFLP